MNGEQVGKLTIKKQVVNKQVVNKRIVKKHGRLLFRHDGQASHEAGREDAYLDVLYRGHLPLHQPLAADEPSWIVVVQMCCLLPSCFFDNQIGRLSVLKRCCLPANPVAE